MVTVESDEATGKSAEEDLATLFREADAAAGSEAWDQAIDLYRRVHESDRAYPGAEAKLQRALRMRDLQALYREGQEHLTARRYGEALASLRKARSNYAGHYKDVDALIVQAESGLQKQEWQARSRSASTRKGCFLTSAVAASLTLVLAFVSACGPAAPAAAEHAAQLAPQQRSNMYKSAPPMAIDANKTYVATIQAAKGNIVVDLFPKDAPQTVNNFVFLARDGFYNDLTFHRVVAQFVIQGGDPLGTGTGGPGYTLPAEIKGKHTKGAIAMARLPDQANPRRDSSGSQFYITLEAQPSLDGQYTVFGQVTQGMDVVQNILQGDKIKTITISDK